MTFELNCQTYFLYLSSFARYYKMSSAFYLYVLLIKIIHPCLVKNISIISENVCEQIYDKTRKLTKNHGLRLTLSKKFFSIFVDITFSNSFCCLQKISKKLSYKQAITLCCQSFWLHV